MSYDCFISYRSTDRELAVRVYDGLASAGIDPGRIWYDRERLTAGDRWNAKIEEACESSRVVLPVLTPRWQSEWTLFETFGAENVIPLVFDGRFEKITPAALHHYQAEAISFAGEVFAADWQRLADRIRTIVATTPPTKHARVDALPYRPNKAFTGRAATLMAIHENLHGVTTGRTRGGVVVLAGMGGAGKTTLARQYAEKFWRAYPTILWVDGRNPGGLDAEYAALFETLFPEERSAEIADPKKAGRVKDKLRAGKDWLLIVDNAEDPETVERGIPSPAEFHTLITSRRTDWAASFHKIVVSELDPAAAREFLSKRTELPTSDPAEVEARDELAHALGYLPLALEQAAAYISKQKRNFRSYLETYRRAAADLLRKGVRGSTEYPDPVFLTWKATIEKLSLASRALLRTAAFLGEAPVPVRLLVEGDQTLRRGIELMKEIAPAGIRSGPDAEDAEVWVEEVLGELESYSMAQLRQVQLGSMVVNVAAIHALVQTVERASLSPGDRAHWTLAAASFLDACPEDPTDPKEWPFLRLATAHLTAAVTHAFQLLGEETLADSGGRRISQLELAEAMVAVLEYCARFEHALERIEAAESRLRLALSLDERLPRDPRRTVRLLQSAQSLLVGAGRLAEAEPLARRALLLYEEELGPDHPTVADALSRLAAVVGELGRWNEAEAQLLRALRLLDPHGDSPDSREPRRDLLAQLGQLYASAGRDAEAESAFARTRELDEELARSSEDGLVARRDLLIRTWQAVNDGRDADAERFALEFVTANRPEQEATVRDLPSALGSAAAVFERLRRFDLAEQCLIEKLALDESAYTVEHPQFAEALEELAGLYIEVDRETDAEARLRQALAILDRAYPRGHPRVARVLAQLGRLLARADRLDDAQPLLQRAIAVHASIPGVPALALADYRNSLAEVLIRAGKQVEARPLMDQVAAAYEQQYGHESVQLADRLSDWAVNLIRAGADADAEALVRKALTIKEGALGSDSPELLRELDRLAATIDPGARSGEAEEIVRRALAICEGSLGADHAKAMYWRDWLWPLLARKGDTAEAARLLKASIELRERAPAPDAEELGSDCTRLAKLLLLAGAGPDGEPYARRGVRSLLALSAHGGQRHPMLARAIDAWHACLHATGKTPKENGATVVALFAEFGLEELIPELLAEIQASAQADTLH